MVSTEWSHSVHLTYIMIILIVLIEASW